MFYNFLDYFCVFMNKLKGRKDIWIGDMNVQDQNKISAQDYKNLIQRLNILLWFKPFKIIPG